MKGRLTQMSNYESVGTDLCTSGLERPRQFPVVRLEISQLEFLAAVLNHAFQNEPHFKYLLPDEQTRRTVLPWFFRSITRASHLSGEIYTTENIEGAALWIRPGRSVTFEGIVRTGMLAPLFKLGWTSFRRCINLSARVDAVHRRLALGPHWYLMALRVKPSELSNAVGGALLQPVLSRADSDGLPCYLETFRERDLLFYEDCGFRVEGAGRIPGRGPNFWAMVRAPQ